MKKYFDHDAFKKKHQEKYILRALHGREDTHGADVHGERKARVSGGHERGRGPANERGRGRDKTVDPVKYPDQGDVMCFSCESTEHHGGDLECPKLAPKSRAAVQKRAEFSDGNKGEQKICKQVRDLKQLRNEKKAHFCMLGTNINAEDMEDVAWTTRTITRTKTKKTDFPLGQ